MIELAGAEPTGNPQLHDLFEKGLHEVDRTRIGMAEAGRIIARGYARQICDKEITPIDGARAIWRVTLECRELDPELGIFGGRASEYEDLPELSQNLVNK